MAEINQQVCGFIIAIVEVQNNQFTSMKNAIAALNTSASEPAANAQFSNAVNLSLENIDRALDNVLQIHSRVGSRLNVIENQLSVNQDFNLAAAETLSKVRDLDLASAITELTQQQIGLEAAQASFVRIQGLSLFNFLR
jgi:flagellar hook-associated protein 3 FlgL